MQGLISGLNRRLDQLQSQASHAQDESANLRQQAAVLHAQHEILQRENQRLLHSYTEESTARCQLEAQRETAARMTKEQQVLDANERGRLHHELSSLHRSLGEVQRQLTEERSSHQHSFSSVQTVQEAADARCRTTCQLTKAGACVCSTLDFSRCDTHVQDTSVGCNLVTYTLSHIIEVTSFVLMSQGL